MQDLRSTPRATVTGALNALFRYEPVAALNRYHGPKLSVITPLNETPLALHKLVPDLPFTTLTGTGHWLQMDKREAFNQILDGFLASIENDNPFTEER